MIQKMSEEQPATNMLSVTAPPRDVRLGYYIHSPSDVPQGFQITVPPSEWFRAMFIPGNAGPSRAERYPARIYVLTRDLLIVTSHSDSQEQPFITKLSDLVELYSHKKEGQGELVFTGTAQSSRFCYSPIQRQCIDTFLFAMRSLWLHSAKIRPQEIAWPHRLSPWHRFVLENELDPGETLVAMLTPSQSQQTRIWPFISRTGYLETSFVVLTDRRLMWFKFTEQPGTCPASVTVRCVPRERSLKVSANTGSFQSEETELEILFTPAHRWCLKVKTGRAPSLTALIGELSCLSDIGSPRTG